MIGPDPDFLWGALFDSISAHESLWMTIGQRISKPPDVRLMRKFLHETWNRVVETRNELGRTLRVPLEQRITAVRYVGAMVLDARSVAQKLGLSAPELGERDRGWVYEAIIRQTDDALQPFADTQVRGVQSSQEAAMNSPDPWRSIIGAHHGHHGGGHHHGGGGGRRYFGGGGGYSYPYPVYPYWDPYAYAPEPEVVVIDNRVRRLVQDGRGGYRTMIGYDRGVPRTRDGVLGEVAPVIAPGTGGITVKLELDGNQMMTAAICVDGQCYSGSVNLAPAIAAVMKQLAQQHAGWHKTTVVGFGECGYRLYQGVTKDVLNTILDRLKAGGATISGNNPWTIDTHDHGVELKGTWYRATGKILLEVTGSSVPCGSVWKHLDPMLSSVGARPDDPIGSGEHAVGAIDAAVHAAGEAMVDTLVDHHVGVVCAGWMDKLKKKAKGTLKKMRGPISKAAGAAAAAGVSSIPGGAALAPMAKSLATNIVNSAAGDEDAKKVVDKVKAEAKNNPAMNKALKIATKAVAQTTAAYHVAETAKDAKEGDHEAKQEINKIEKAAGEGDKAAKAALEVASTATGQAPPPAADPMPAEAPADPKPATDPWEATRSDPAPANTSGPVTSPPDLPGPTTDRVKGKGKKTKVEGELPAPGELAEYRRVAVRAVWSVMKQKESPFYGYRRLGKNQRVLLFAKLEEAAAWYAKLDPGYTYAAVFDAKHMAMAATNDSRVTPLAESMERVDWSIPPTVSGDPTAPVAVALATVRKQALDAARDLQSQVVGIVRWADTNWSLEPFGSVDQADDWLGEITSQPRLFTYAAYYDKTDRTWPGPVNEKIGGGQPKRRSSISGELIGADPGGVRSPTSTSSEVRSPTSTSTEVRSPTSTSTEVRSPTSTSTDAYTQGNVTVTGGAGAGATIVHIYGNAPQQPKRADEEAHLERSRGVAWRPENLMRETGAPRPGPIPSTMGPTGAPRAFSPIPDMMDAVSSERAPSPMAHMVRGVEPGMHAPDNSPPTGRPVLRVPVLDAAGNVTRQFALWVLPYQLPDYYQQAGDGDVWIRRVTSDEDAFWRRAALVDNRRAYYPNFKATLTGDPGRRADLPHTSPDADPARV